MGVAGLGATIAARLYPAPFAWAYTVISALASQKHNPAGAVWFAAALGLALALLWPVTTRLRRAIGPGELLARLSIGALRTGLIFGMLVSVESMVFFDFSQYVHKGHELLALVAFLGAYAGVLGLLVHHARRRPAMRWTLMFVVLPLVAVGCSELILYLSQRNIGWLDHNWRASGKPVWLSFAFWQWLAAVSLWGGIGRLLQISPNGTVQP